MHRDASALLRRRPAPLSPVLFLGPLLALPDDYCISRRGRITGHSVGHRSEHFRHSCPRLRVRRLPQNNARCLHSPGQRWSTSPKGPSRRTSSSAAVGASPTLGAHSTCFRAWTLPRRARTGLSWDAVSRRAAIVSSLGSPVPASTTSTARPTAFPVRARSRRRSCLRPSWSMIGCISTPNCISKRRSGWPPSKGSYPFPAVQDCHPAEGNGLAVVGAM
jgi:hypothetical protein